MNLKIPLKQLEKLNYRCCFCNRMIDSNQVDPCDLNILINLDKPKEKQDSQSFYCHAQCFKEKLHPHMLNLCVVDIVDDE